MKRLWLGLLLSAFAFGQTAEDAARLTETRLAGIRTLQADFEHFYYSSTVSTPLKEKGRFYLQKPDLMRWEYRDPEEKIFLVNHGFLWDYDAGEKLVIKYDLENSEGDYEILSLLSGKTSFFEDYEIEFSPFPTKEKNVWQLKLTPKAEEKADTYILLEIEKKTRLIKKIVSFDWADNKQEFHFSRIKTNISFGKDVFELKLPNDVEIIEDIRGPNE